MKSAEQLTHALAPLVGLPLLYATQAAAMLSLGFGAARDVSAGLRGTETKTVGDYALHVDCAWRLLFRRQVFVGSGDYGTYAAEQRWGSARLEGLIEAHRDAPLVVKTVAVAPAGASRLGFDHGYTLEVSPDRSCHEEFWRIWSWDERGNHFVVEGTDFQLELSVPDVWSRQPKADSAAALADRLDLQLDLNSPDWAAELGDAARVSEFVEHLTRGGLDEGERFLLAEITFESLEKSFAQTESVHASWPRFKEYLVLNARLHASTMVRWVEADSWTSSVLLPLFLRLRAQWEARAGG